MPGIEGVLWGMDLDARLNEYGTLFLFLPIVIGVYWALRRNEHRLIWLTIASIAFYSFWDWRFTPLLLASIVVDYWLALKAAGGNKRWMWASVVVNLGVLAVFKYLVFAVVNVNGLADWLGASGRLPVPDIVLPLGISFYLFHTLSYTIDSYRGTIVPTRDFVKFAAYVMLFPQLVAGPIVRYSEVGEQLSTRQPFDKDGFYQGLERLCIGLAKKVLVADFIASRIDPLWIPGTDLSGVGVLALLLGFALQLYFDFSGYSDMAIGVARMMGYRFPENFDRPYTARNPAEFWQRWHMTLSRFIRDYLYLPLGGNRRGVWGNALVLVCVWALVGFWHGASWTMVIWGLWNGVAILVYRAVRGGWDMMPPVAGQLFTFSFWVASIAFFRAESVWHSLEVLGQLARTTGWAPSANQVVAIFVGVALTMVPRRVDTLKHPLIRPAATGAVFGLALLGMNAPQQPFIYFQF
ncbi:MAG TPA: MBOAT family O-acyltransferase [Candidatus Thermoplasmatota archaeon]|nr:MBOAT family O-acyltransferase [Candidatus Thermoplasmatota archaeon]